MQEKVRLLMEETGCEQGEAELALELAGDNLENAIKTIGSLLRHIVAIKGKFNFPAKNLYGLFLIIVNTKTHEILRLHTVVSYNPALYEHSPEMDWYALEKLIFSFRLDEGSLPDFTQESEQKLQSYLLAQKDVLVRCNAGEITSLLNEFFFPEKVTIKLLVEELNLAQFRRLPSEEPAVKEKVVPHDGEPGTVWLTVNLIEDANGKEAGKLIEGEVIETQITDTRDIAHYLAHLIGGRRGSDLVPLPAVVRRIAVHQKEAEIQIYFAPGIAGAARVTTDTKLKVLETKSQPWWKKIIPWT